MIRNENQYIRHWLYDFRCKFNVHFVFKSKNTVDVLLPVFIILRNFLDNVWMCYACIAFAEKAKILEIKT